jgi:hypothetical protein
VLYIHPSRVRHVLLYIEADTSYMYIDIKYSHIESQDTKRKTFDLIYQESSLFNHKAHTAPYIIVQRSIILLSCTVFWTHNPLRRVYRWTRTNNNAYNAILHDYTYIARVIDFEFISHSIIYTPYAYAVYIIYHIVSVWYVYMRICTCI